MLIKNENIVWERGAIITRSSPFKINFLRLWQYFESLNESITFNLIISEICVTRRGIVRLNLINTSQLHNLTPIGYHNSCLTQLFINERRERMPRVLFQHVRCYSICIFTGRSASRYPNVFTNISSEYRVYVVNNNNYVR